MNASPEAQKLARIRSAVAMLDGDEWLLTADGEGMALDARGRDGSIVSIARLDGKANADEVELISGALDNTRFLLGLVDRCAAKVWELSGPSTGSGQDEGGGVSSPASAPVAKNYAAEAAMQCEKPAFLKFLEERHGLERPLTPDRAAQKVRSLCGVTSRRELNDDTAAAERWKRLKREFKAWRRQG